MQCYFCGLKATQQLFFIAARQITRETQVCADHAVTLLQREQPRPQGEPFTEGRLVQFEIEQLHRMLISTKPSDSDCIILQESGGTRRMQVTLGRCEASTLERLLQPQRTPRPLTPEAFARTLHSLGGKLVHIAITQLLQGTYFAVLRINQNGRRFEIDLRPSDALAVAVSCQAPIFVLVSLIPADVGGDPTAASR